MAYLHATIEVNCVKLEVIGRYYAGEDESLDSQGEPESVEIEQVLTANGDDIGGLLGFSDELSSHIEALAMEAHKDGIICAAQDAADRNREYLREMGEQ
jgi:hypothetical protein